MKQAVLCVLRSLLPKELRTTQAVITPVDLSTIPADAYNFINRNVADAKREVNTTHFSIGTMFPQVLPYMVIKCGNEYLMYHRKGTEDRLHGKTSLGIGGHIDLPDYPFAADECHTYEPLFADVIQHSAQRELSEEVGYVLEEGKIDFTYAILSPVDEVSQVHIGLLACIEVQSKSVIKPTAEIIDPFWVHESDLMKYHQSSEEWTKLIIEGKFQDARYT